MPAYTIHGGPCHYDVQLCYYLFLGARYARRFIGNVYTNEGRGRVRRTSRRLQKSISEQFHSFFNPDLGDGEWRLYEFGECCEFHIDIDIRLPPGEWFGLDEDGIRQRLPPGCAMLVVEAIDMDEHPHASLSGERLLVGHEGDRYTLAHEIGHNLGLPDDYHTPAVPELGVVDNEMSDEEEERHRGHLMGKKRGGVREIQPHEIGAVARSLGLTCDAERCCPDRRGRGRGPAREERNPDEREQRKHHSEPEQEVLVPSPPAAFGAHAGSALSFDIAADMVGASRVPPLSSVPRAVLGPDARLTRKLEGLVSVDAFVDSRIEATVADCPVEATLAVMGGVQVDSLDPDDLTPDQWALLLEDWNRQAAECMQTYCDRAAPSGCRAVQPISVSVPPRFRAIPSADGTPPHVLLIEMDITFRCVASA